MGVACMQVAETASTTIAELSPEQADTVRRLARSLVASCMQLHAAAARYDVLAHVTSTLTEHTQQAQHAAGSSNLKRKAENPRKHVAADAPSVQEEIITPACACWPAGATGERIRTPISAGDSDSRTLLQTYCKNFEKSIIEVLEVSGATAMGVAVRQAPSVACTDTAPPAQPQETHAMGIPQQLLPSVRTVTCLGATECSAADRGPRRRRGDCCGRFRRLYTMCGPKTHQ